MILAGQIMGWVAALMTFLSYQCKDHKKLLIVQTLSSLSICISYLLLSAWSGMLLNVICIVRNFIIYRKDIKIFSYSFWPYALAAVMGTGGLLSWQGPMSLLVIVALVANTVFLYFPNVQNLRKSILITSTMVLIYNAYYNVWGGVVNEMIAIASSAVAIYRYRNTNQRQ
ncbi:MAG: YgjV family protein [Ruminococcaceae bacterium]|nr:YgjV family protein [Oscillospiraceae bacterium]